VSLAQENHKKDTHIPETDGVRTSTWVPKRRISKPRTTRKEAKRDLTMEMSVLFLDHSDCDSESERERNGGLPGS
jgi:hypothetical protein